MDHQQWLAAATRNATRNAIAEKSGIYPATLNRQLDRGSLPPETVIKIARAYGTPIPYALAATGHITYEEAGLAAHPDLPILEVLQKSTDEQLLTELLRRVGENGQIIHPPLTELPVIPN